MSQTNPHYFSYRDYLTHRFNASVLKIPVNAGFSCPNRDGLISVSGCSFCDNRSFSPVALSAKSVLDQLDAAIAKDKNKHGKYIAYFQPFSNTYAPLSRLQEIFEPVIALNSIAGIAIGTRPDCFTDDIYDYLGHLANRTYCSVELGLQSADNDVLTLHKRGHTVEDFITAVEKLHAKNIEVVAHVMVGLAPNAAEDARKTAQLLAELPVDGVKIHQLMIIQGTELETMFANHTIKVLSLEEYANIVCDFLEILRPNQHIHRIMADSKIKKGLVEPLWSADKMKSMGFIHAVMDKREIRQGAKFHPSTRHCPDLH